MLKEIEVNVFSFIRLLHHRWTCLFCACLFLTTINLFSFNCSTVNAAVVEADHKFIRYTGRIDQTNPKAPSLWWPGSEVSIRFEGTSIKVKLEDLGDNYFYVIIDDGVPKLINLTPGISTYEVASGLNDSTHTLKLFKRTETQEGQTVLHGFLLESGKSLLALPTRPTRRIEFYGDSITSGHSVASKNGDTNNADGKDNYYAYSGLTARKLNAEYHCISVSGIGLYVDTWGAGGNMQTLFYDRLSPSKKWNFDQWVPQLVVINLGQNDAWGNHTGEDVKKNYINFTRKIREHYPDAHIILALGSMDATSDGSPWPSYLRSSVKTFRDDFGDSKVYEFIFPFSGAPHPTAERQAVMAEQLVEFIQVNIPGFEE